MKIKAIWGFVGNGALLGHDSNKVKAGAVFEEADDEYAHTLIGKNLAVELDASGKPPILKPKESKPVAPREEKAAVVKEASDKAPAEYVLAEKAVAEAADKADAKETK